MITSLGMPLTWALLLSAGLHLCILWWPNHTQQTAEPKTSVQTTFYLEPVNQGITTPALTSNPSTPTHTLPPVHSRGAVGATGKAQVLGEIKPPYPVASRKLGEQGSVIVKVQVNAEGTVTQAKIIQSSGFSRLDQAAQTAVKNARFQPQRLNNTPVASEGNFTFKFSLD